MSFTIASVAGTLPASPTSIAEARVRQRQVVALMLVVAVAIAAAALTFLPLLSASKAADPEWLSLIRGMAIIKAVLALIAGSAVAWRLGRLPGIPVSAFVEISYLMGVWLMVLGSVVAWQCVYVGWAALLFHTGELTVLTTAWRDGCAPLRTKFHP